MTAAVGKYAAKKLLGEQMKKHKDKNPVGSDDPFFTYVPGRNGKMKKVKKQIPEWIPDHDAQVLSAAKRRAYHLDMSLFSFAGIRFGWSSVIGLIPEVGDVIDCFMAYGVYKKCCKVEGGLPSSISSRMQLNIVIDFLIGLVPFLGDLADAAFRANTKNVALLERFLYEKYGPKDKKQREEAGLETFSDDEDIPLRTKGDTHGRPTEAGHRSAPDNHHREHRSAPEDHHREHRSGPEDHHREHRSAPEDHHREHRAPTDRTIQGTKTPKPPPAASQPRDQRDGARGGFFSGWGRKQKPRDVEMGP